MRPGDVFIKDYRSRDCEHGCKEGAIRLLQWNIERGYELPGILKTLREANADIIALQEVDVDCERSGSIDVGRYIARELQYNYAFLCEFEEIRSECRSARDQGGGYHGNAFLTRFDMSGLRSVPHQLQPVDWENPSSHPAVKREPRNGQRSVLAATIHTPQGNLLCYNLHLEVFCGMLSRMIQFADVLHDVRGAIKTGQYHVAVLGDLNTMAHGIARLSPNYCCDVMRFWSLWLYEAQVWDREIFSCQDPIFDPSKDGQICSAQAADGQEYNKRLEAYGIPVDVCRQLLNPGFADPFDPVDDVTLDNPSYKIFGVSLMKGKLDWVLLRRLQVVDKQTGNHDYRHSDHKWLHVDVKFQ